MPPNNLAVYLSNRCNLACRYCYVAVNVGPALRLTAEQVRAAVDGFLQAPSEAERKVSFLGGEPLLSWDVLSDSVRYARRRGGRGLLLQVFTNGAGLSGDRLAFLLAHGVEVTVSLDGDASTNDANRPLHGREGSSYEAAMKRLEGLPKGALGVNMVFTTKTLDRLLANIELFRREGFGRLSFTPDLNERWPLERVADLRTVMEGFGRYYARLARAGRPFAIANLYALLEKARGAPGRYWWHDCHNLVLGPDGSFYSCDKSLGLPEAAAALDRVGTPGAGVDWRRRETRYEEARRAVEAAAGDSGAFTSCPMGVYFVETALGRDASPAISDFERVSQAYGEPLLALARELWDEPSFRRAHSIPDGEAVPA